MCAVGGVGDTMRKSGAVSTWIQNGLARVMDEVLRKKLVENQRGTGGVWPLPILLRHF